VIFQWSENETEIDENIRILHSSAPKFPKRHY